MLSGSVLGGVYRCWLDSTVFAILRAVYRFFLRAVSGSRILHAAFARTRLDGIFSDSVFARLFRKLVNFAVTVCRSIVGALRGSVICTFLAPAVKSSKILNFEFLFGVFICVMFAVPHDYWNNLYGVIAAVVFLLLYLLLCAADKRRLVHPDVLGLGFTLFALSCVLSLGVTSALGDSFRILLLFLAAFVFCWLIAVTFDAPKSLRRLMGWLYLCLLIVCFIGIMQRVLDTVEVNYSFTDMIRNKGVPGRIYATLDNPNNLSGFIQLFLPLGAAYAAGAKRPWQRLLLAVGLLIPTVALVMTYARAGWISIVLAAAVFVYCCNKKLIPALLVLLLLALPFLPKSVLTRLSTIGNTADTSTNHRFSIWKGVLALLGDNNNWITGIGLGPDAFQNVYPAYSYGIARTGAYHSQMLYLELDLEMGILGFLSFLWMMMKYAGRFGRNIAACRSRNIRLTLIASMATIIALAFSAIVEYLWFYQRCIFAFFIFLGVAIAAARVAEREEA